MGAKLEIFIKAQDGASPVFRKLKIPLDDLKKSSAASGSALDSLGKIADNAGKRMQSLGSSLTSLGTKMTLAITLPLVAAATAVTKFAIDAVESENLFEVSLGKMADNAREWSEDISKALRLNSYEVRRQVGTWDVMLKQMGIGEGAALEMSKAMTQLSFDMASFYNLSPTDAFSKLQAGITGEIEPLKRLGIVVNETVIENWALTQGLIKQGEEMSEAQKIAARYAVIMQQTATAQGDLARTAESPANQLRALRAQLELTAISAGQMLLPAVSQGLIWLNNEGLPKVTAGLENFQTAWTEMSDHAKTRLLLVAGLFVAGGPLLAALGVAIRGVGLLISAFAMLPGPVKIAVLLALPALQMLRDMTAQTAENIGHLIFAIGNLGKNMLNLLGFQGESNALMEAGRGIMDFSKRIKGWNVVGDLVALSVDEAKKMADSIVGNLVTEIEGLGKGVIDEATKGWEKNAKAGASARKEYEKMKDPLNFIKDIWPTLADGMAKAGQAGKDAKEAMSGALDAARDSASALKDALSAAKDKMSELSRTPILGEGQLDERKFNLQQQMNKVQLAITNWKLRFSGRNVPESILKPLEAQLDKLRLTAEKVDLEGRLKFEPLRRKIDQMVDQQKELTFGAIIRGLKEQREQMTLLEPKLSAAELLVKALEKAYKALGDTVAQTAAKIASSPAPIISAIPRGLFEHEPGLRAAGGPVTAGQPYIVGEKQAELFVPSASGVILPSARAASASGGSGGGVNLTYAPVVNVSGGGSDIVGTIKAVLKEEAQTMRTHLRVAMAQGART